MAMRGLKSAVSPMTLRELVDTGVVTTCAAIRYDDDGQGLVGIVLVGSDELFLGTARGNEPRYFTSIDGLVSAFQDCGINDFKLDARGFVSRGKQASARRGFGRSAQGKLGV